MFEPLASAFFLATKSAVRSSELCPPNTLHAISMLLSSSDLSGFGGVSTARDALNAQRHRIFHWSIPVRLLALIRISLPLWLILTVSMGGFMIPKVSGFNDGAAQRIIEFKAIGAGDGGLESGEVLLVDFLVGGEQDYLMGGDREVALH